MTARRTAALVLASAALAAGCRSPFEKPRGPSAEEWRVGRGFHAWPVFEYAPEDEGSRTDVLWPALSVWWGADALETVEYLYPLGEWHRKGGYARTAFRPFFDLVTEEPTQKEPQGVYDLDAVWPFVKWRTSAARDERRVFPFYFSGRTRNSDWFHVWPVYGDEHEGTHETHWIAAPLVNWQCDDKDHASEWNVLLGAFHHGDSDAESSWRALPLLWHDASKKDATHATVLFPFWWDFQGEDSRFRMLFPLYGEEREGEDASTVVVGGPLYVGRRDGDMTSTGVLWPLVDVTTSDVGWSWRVAPVLWFGDDGRSRSHAAVWPFWVERTNGDETSRGVVWPLTDVTTSKDAWSWRVAPFLWFGADEAQGSGHASVWPLFLSWHGKDDATFAALPPLFWHERDGDETSWFAPWPLVHFVRAPDHGETLVFPFDHEWTKDTSRGSLLWFLSTWESDEKEHTSDFRVLWRLVESTSTEHRSAFVVNPLWRRETNDRGDSYWSVLFGLLARKQEAGEVSWRVLWFL